ncbi:MAG: DUF465 domain-containing protein [Alphaproteobacteria bacterium]|nr:DUF465 domain-containing protein [Alphaproteobacteria bacterium]|tara:strand:- start:402 stop:578 length:177 start_codon:yes stop_codon:yes gene_type:complete
MDRIELKEKKIKSLVLKHEKFENLLEKASRSRSTDNLTITSLKKKKLKIRDEILRLTA